MNTKHFEVVLWSKLSTLDRKVEGSNPAAANFSFEVDDLDARKKKEDRNENRRAREQPLTSKRARNKCYVLCTRPTIQILNQHIRKCHFFWYWSDCPIFKWHSNIGPFCLRPLFLPFEYQTSMVLRSPLYK